MGRRFAAGDAVRTKATGVIWHVVADNGHAYKISRASWGIRGAWFHQDEIESALRVLNDVFSILSYDGGMEKDTHGIENILKPSLQPFHCSGPGLGHTVDLCVAQDSLPVLLTHIALHGAPGCGEPLRCGRIWAGDSVEAFDIAHPLMSFETDKLKAEWSSSLPEPTAARAVRIMFDGSHGKGENVDVGMLALVGVMANESLPGSDTCSKAVPGALSVTGLRHVKKRKHWLPLESNPNVVGKYLAKLGASPGITVHELLSMEAWAMDMIPHRARALLLCFPISDETETSRKAGLAAGLGKELPADIVHMKQVVGNACGTIAIIHVMANLCRHGGERASPGSWLDKFLSAYKDGMTSDDVGAMLEEDAAIEAAHAEAEAASEARHNRAANRDLHFIAFVEIHGLVVELDGRNDRCIVRGPIAELGRDFLSAAVAVVRVNYVEVSKDALRFNMMAVCSAGANQNASVDASAADTPSISEEAVAQLTAFGFDADTARGALVAAGGNVEIAANRLLGDSHNTNAGALGAGAPSVSEEAVAQLMAFGFDAEIARGALVAAGGNVEIAANRLLG